ncbi:unnamed protein product [Musa acuminata var. zebrina]
MAPSSTSYPPLSSASTERVPQQLRVGSVRGLVDTFDRATDISFCEWIASHGDIWWLATTRRPCISRMTAIISEFAVSRKATRLRIEGRHWNHAALDPGTDSDGKAGGRRGRCGRHHQPVVWEARRRRRRSCLPACLPCACPPISFLSLSLSHSPTQDNKHGTPSPGSSQS